MGYFWPPPSGVLSGSIGRADVVRPASRVSVTVSKKNSFSYQDLIECGHGLLFGQGNAQLPLPPMLMFDRIVRINEDGGNYGKGEIVAEMDVDPEKWFFKCHFEGDPVMPGCLGLDSLWQIAGFFLGWLNLPGKGRALGVGEVKFAGQVAPKAKLLSYHIHIKKVIKRRFSLAIADGVALLDGEKVYEAKNLRVGVFPEGQTT